MKFLTSLKNDILIIKIWIKKHPKISLVFIALVIAIPILVKVFGVSRQLKNWVVSQGVYTSIAKQEALFDRTRDGGVQLKDVVELSTKDHLPKAEAVKIGNKILISTGLKGEAVVTIAKGVYEVSVVPIPGVDVTGVAKEIVVSSLAHELPLGLAVGSGEVKAKQAQGQSYDSNSFDTASSQLIITLYKDANGNGEKDQNEPKLQWAGVTVQLIKKS